MISSIVSRLEKFLPTREKREGASPQPISHPNILSEYVLGHPSDQNILDIFQDEWSSALPEKYGLKTQPGFAHVFEDPRIVWAEEVLGGFRGRKILELGPLEGGHSYMIHRRGATKITSIEANSRAFLKCLCIKEILKLESVEFLLGDFMEYLRSTEKRYDVVLASGVLYHMEEPVELVKLLSKVSDRVFIWTHYYDAEILAIDGPNRNRFSGIHTLTYENSSYEYGAQSYNEALNWTGFCGGPKLKSKWLTRESLIKALKCYGLTELSLNFEQPDHPNGPALAICATR